MQEKLQRMSSATDDNEFLTAISYSALAALNFKISEGVITKWHKMATFLHPSKRNFKGMNLEEEAKQNVCHILL